MPRVGVVIAAGGKGRRLGRRLPKQFLPLAGIPILQRTIELFDSLRLVDEIVITSPREHMPRVRNLLARIGSGKILSIVPGGRERQDSVWNGLHGFLSKPDIVLVHDAVRPLTGGGTVNRVIAAAAKYSAAVVGVRVQDTIKVEEKNGFYARTLTRTNLWAVQTPQGFSFDLLMRAHKAARRSGYLGTDEASLVERLGVPVRIVEGDRMNIKITTPVDIHLAEILLKKGGHCAQ